MPGKWMDVSNLSFNTLLLLEEVQLSWLPGWLPEKELQVALKANPVVEWYLRTKCPPLNNWLDKVMSTNQDMRPLSSSETRQAEVAILSTMTDLIVYAVDPSIYDAQPFLNWESTELLSLTDFTEKTVIDVGAGTGRLTLVVAEAANSVFAVEPVTNLRKYIKSEAQTRNLDNVFPVDGLITDIPFPSQFADITMAGHVFGEFVDLEYKELTRVTKSGGMIILCPGNTDEDNEIHQFLVSHDFVWSRFEEPQDGVKRKYWKIV